MNLQPPGKPIQSFILAQGQRDGEIEVLEIDEKAGSVKVNQSGTVTTLTFEKNGAKLPASVAAAAPAPNPGGFVPPPQPVNPYLPPSGPPAGGLKTIPTRQLRVPTPGQSGAGAGGPPSPGFRPGPNQQ
jgi:hypothetical protein